MSSSKYIEFDNLADILWDKNPNQAYLCLSQAGIYIGTDATCDVDDSSEAVEKKKFLEEKIEKLLFEKNITVNPAIIVIVSYNGCYFIQKNIESIRNTLPAGMYSILVVDNASTDGVREWLETQEDVALICNDTNVGFSAACNQAVKVIEESGLENCDIFLLNNDTRLCEDSLFWLQMGLYESDDVGATGSISNYAGNEQNVDIEFTLPTEYLEYGKKNNVPMPNPYEERVRLSGFAMLIRGGLWQQAGGMDEDFSPGYFEDDDLSMKISSMGYRLVLCKNSFIYHAGSQSFSKRDDIEQLLRSHYELFIKKYGFPILDFAYPNREMIDYAGIPFDIPANILCIGSGLGAELRYLRSRYPSVNVIGIEKNPQMARIAGCIDAVSDNVISLSQQLTTGVFDILFVTERGRTFLTKEELDILPTLCKPQCRVIYENDVKENDNTGNGTARKDTGAVDFSKIKLVIWDLDNTFWKGILSEGNIIIPDENRELIVNLSYGGIVCSISSKNDSNNAEDELRQAGLLDYFVFNNINWDNKGEQIKSKLDAMHLRPENVLFIDDDIRNLKEAAYFNPGLMVAGPEIIEELISFANELPKDEKSQKRLEKYKLLEKKEKDALSFKDTETFLTESQIRVEISENSEDGLGIEADRVAELAQRTNQLNYTKLRSSKEELLTDWNNPDNRCGYIKVTDKYGDYGTVGFFVLEKNKDSSLGGTLKHFVFSCRIIGMGIPEYVYDFLGRPKLNVEEPVAEKLTGRKTPWINTSGKQSQTNGEVEPGPRNQEACNPGEGNQRAVKLLLKGPCDLDSVAPYLSGGDITAEFNFVNSKGFITTGMNHTVNICQSAQLSKKEIDEIVSEVPFIVKEDFETVLFKERFDVICLSLLPDCHAGLYKNKRTGHFINFGSVNFDLTDPKNTEGYIDGSIVNHAFLFNRKIIEEFSNNWEFVGTTEPIMLLENLDYIYENIPGNPIIILLLGSETEYEGDNPEFANHAKRHREVNELVREFAKDHDRIRLINPTDYIHSQQDYFDSINHFSRNVYYDIATRIVEIINKEL